MSVHFLSPAWKLTADSSTEKLVLLKLADNANDQGVCWPSISHIARECHLSERCVREQMRSLEEKGWLKTTARSGHSSYYQLTLPTPEPGAPDKTPAPRSAPAPGAPTPERSAPPPRNLTTLTPEPGAPRTVREPSVEPYMNPEARIRAIHEWYSETRGGDLPLDEFSKRLWFDFFKAGHSEDDFKQVFKMKNENKMNGDHPASMYLSNLLAPDRFPDFLADAKNGVVKQPRAGGKPERKTHQFITDLQKEIERDK